MAYTHNQPGDPVFDAKTIQAARGSKNATAWLDKRGWGVQQAVAFLPQEKAQKLIRYEVQQSINDGQGLVIARYGDDYCATYVVSEDNAGYSDNPSDTDICPVSGDGCWPEPPQYMIREARRLAMATSA